MKLYNEKYVGHFGVAQIRCCLLSDCNEQRNKTSYTEETADDSAGLLHSIYRTNKRKKQAKALQQK